MIICLCIKRVIGGDSMNIFQQFQMIMDPSTTLGAFTISVAASMFVGFLTGFKCKKIINKNNTIVADKTNNISQDITNSAEIKDINKIRKSNVIQVGNVEGDIFQDIER